MVTHLDELDYGFEPITPEQAPELMANYSGAWWVAGGWALDLVAGGQTRDHTDLDVGTYRDEVPLLFDALDLELHAAGGGKLHQMSRPADLPPDSNSIWLRRTGHKIWLFEVILNDSNNGDWIYRRDPRIRMDRNSTIIDVDGIPCIKPELQLLFKAKHMRDRDVADFEVHAPRLHPTSRAWLKEALHLAHPGHPWIERL